MPAGGGALPKEIEKAESEAVAFPAHPRKREERSETIVGAMVCQG